MTESESRLLEALGDRVTTLEKGPITRERWVERYAARIASGSDSELAWAKEVAEIGAVEYERSERAAGNAVIWWGGPSGAEGFTPEDQADDEMSYWDDDGE